MMTARRGLAIVTVSGAIGGLLNASLCFLEWPLPVKDPNVKFHWHVVPAGLAHGSLLALVAMGAALFARKRAGRWCWAAVPVVGWLGGYLSWIPLDLAAFGNPVLEALAWPVVRREDSILTLLVAPFWYFGLVAALAYAWLLVRRRHGPRWVDMAVASLAGALGSLWWWSQWGPWYFSLLHGGIWGCCVGWAVSRTDS